MKKILITIILLVILTCPFYSAQKEDNNKELIKRTVMIMPFLNANKVAEYNYLQATLMDTLTAELMWTEQFIITKQRDIENEISRMNLTQEDALTIENAKKIAQSVKSDVIVIGKYVIIKEDILITITAYDVFTQEIVATTNRKGNVGLDIFRVVQDATKDISDKMKTRLKKVESSYFTEMNKLMKKQYQIDQKRKFGITNRIGLGITIPGAILLLGGTGLLIYDLAGYSSILRDVRDDYDKTGENREKYLETYNIFLALFISGAVSAGLGFIMIAAGIPLLVIKIKTKENKKVSFNINYMDKISLSLSYKL
ncbi:MAG: hypothetical protein JXB50_03430 [Spirochaetes bacterium]|nr:hypothetical protein [Spirochaetota bacterium]